jgi:hypothetical protein
MTAGKLRKVFSEQDMSFQRHCDHKEQGGSKEALANRFPPSARAAQQAGRACLDWHAEVSGVTCMGQPTDGMCHHCGYRNEAVDAEGFSPLD